MNMNMITPGMISMLRQHIRDPKKKAMIIEALKKHGLKQEDIDQAIGVLASDQVSSDELAKAAREAGVQAASGVSQSELPKKAGLIDKIKGLF